jgi:DNA polymerase I-like protein with 3'-5' exonuclease and polymerase domains
MNWIVLDSENSTHSKGDAHDLRNVNCLWAYRTDNGVAGTTKNVEEVQRLANSADLIVGFNLAYDLQWLWKLGVSTEGKKFFCCQVAEFLINDQTTPYPSLDDAAQKYLNRQKLDVVKTEYWEKGIDTPDIPPEILAEYALVDVELTAGVYLKQLELITAKRKNLFSIAMQDMAVLAEMRFNGMKYSPEFANQKQQELLEQVEAIKRELNLLHNVPTFNWASNDHLSALLYGGVIEEEVKVPVGFFKSGAKVGQAKFGRQIIKHNLPRIYKPIRGTAMKKEGVWSTDEATLQKLDDGTTLISGILKIRELSKLYGTYFLGIPKKAAESNWNAGMVYGQFNMCVAVTGRLSSTGPNLQNMPDAALRMFTSRFPSE